ncbi:unnamed protein product, partial [Mesorhabditis belari]|uniref:Uncharacterized protein n=1 Tax=Mesorhabditis belari TaxID=2138241 RepID=A0AAF3J2B0_9BILA
MAVLAAPVNGSPIPVTPLPPLVTNENRINHPPTVTLPIHLCPMFMCPMILPESRFSEDSHPIRPCHCPQFPIDHPPMIF